MKTITYTIVLLFFISITKDVSAQEGTAYDKAMISLANNVAQRVKDKKRIKVAVWYFHDTFGKRSVLGDYIGRDFSIHFTNASDEFEVIDRDHFEQVFKEQELQTEGFIDPSTAKQLNMLIGADAIVTGTVDIGLHFLRVRIKVINPETGLQMAAALKSIPIDENLKYILDETGINTSKNIDKNKKRINTNEEYNDSSSTSPNCEQNQTGDYYFKNETNNSFLIYINSRSNINSRFKKRVTVEANQSVTVPDLPVGTYAYSMYKDKLMIIGVEAIQGGFRVEKCKSLSYVISNTTKHSPTKKDNKRSNKIKVRQVFDIIVPILKKKN